MTDFEGFMKKIKGSNKDDDDDGLDIDDELEALEREVNNKPKGKDKGKKKKKKDDDDLNLSDLSDDDEDIEDEGDENMKKKAQAPPQPQPSALKKQSQSVVPPQEKPKPTTKQEPAKPLSQSQPQIQQKPQPSPKAKPGTKDIYLELTEKVYHSTDKMKSMSVLEAEKVICDKIIKYKIDNGFDNYDIWEAKKNLIDVNANKVQNMIENNLLDINNYKKLIQSELEFCQKLLEYSKKDKKLEPQEIEELTNRLKERIKLIEAELSESFEPEEEEQPKQEPSKEELKPIESIPKENAKEEVIEKPKDKPIQPESKQVSDPEPKGVPKNIKINDELIQELNTRIEEYKAAYKYFKEHYLEDQMNRSLQDIKELVLSIKLLEAGKDKEVDEFSLPQGVTPEYIVGLPGKERIKHYKDLINELNAQKNEIAKSLSALSDKFKSMTKAEFKKIAEAAKKDIEAKKAKIEKYDKIIKMLLENAKNPWIPAPLFSKVPEEEKIEKINESIPEYTMVIHFGATEYNDSKQYLNVILNMGDKNKNEYVYAKTKEFFNDDLQWQFEKNEFKHLHRKELEIQVMSKGFLSSKKIGTVKIKLTDLKDKCEKKSSYEIDMEDKKKGGSKGPNMQIHIQLRTPFAEKEYSIKTKEVFTVTRIYPPFKGEGITQSTIIDHKTVPYNAPINKIATTSEKENPKPIAQPQLQSKQPQSKIQAGKGEANSNKISNSNPNPNPNPNPNKPKVSKALFKEEELDNPDYIDNLNSVEVLTEKEKEIDERIKKIEGRTPKPLRDQLLKIRCKKKVLEEQLGEGAITPSSYMEIIKNQYHHDKQLYDYFEQENMKDKAAIVAGRLKLLLKETNEMIEFLKKSQG